MNLQSDLSFLELMRDASLVVQIVMGILLLFSVFSWSSIFAKWFSIRLAMSRSRQFEQQFWSGQDLNQLYQQTQSGLHDHAGLERLFIAGFREFLKLKKQGRPNPDVIINSVQRAMRAESQREVDRLETRLSWLATTASVSPYIGLFGTVWGIMNAFRGLADVGQATLAQVAPGIAEALIATALGLLAAIPAVMAYNTYANNIDRLSVIFDAFIEEFSNIIQRQLGT